MLFFDSSGRAIRSAGVLVASVVSLATTQHSTMLSGSTDVVVEATGPGATIERPVELSVQGHPELTQRRFLELSLTLVEATSPVHGSFALEDVRTGARTEFGWAEDGGAIELRVGDSFDDSLTFDEPLCPDTAGCTRRLILRVTDLDAPAQIRLEASIRVDGFELPPGEVTLREVAP